MDREYSKTELLGIIAALVRASDADLVGILAEDPRNIVPMESLLRIRDIVYEIYNNSDYIDSLKFEKEVEGKSNQLKCMKEKISSDPVKKEEYRKNLMESLVHVDSSNDSYNLVSREYMPLVNELKLLVAQLR